MESIGQLGGKVTVIIPSAKIASRWNGALQARLRFSPLERFLRSRGQKWSASGNTRITDNLACATIHLIGESLRAGDAQTPTTLCVSQYSTVGEVACAVSSSLAALILEPAYWRSAALVATARLLEKQIGLSAAAHAAAAAARAYGGDADSSQNAAALHIGQAARSAVESNADADAEHAVWLITQRLSPLQLGSPSRAAAGQ